MTLALVLVIAAAIALALILGITVSRTLQISSSPDLGRRIQPIDVEAFRNLVDPAQDEYLRRRLSPLEFLAVRRVRLRAVAAYVQAAGRNAALLTRIGQSALAAGDPLTAGAARQLVDEAVLMRRNCAMVLLKIYVVLAWPNSGLFAAPILHGYQQMSGAAMLLGRLQNPASPVRTSSIL